jgi:hypothetical protein
MARVIWVHATGDTALISVREAKDGAEAECNASAAHGHLAD